MDPLGLGLLAGLASAMPLGPQNAYLLQVGLQLPTARAWGAAALVVGLDVSVSLTGAGLVASALAGAPHLRAPALAVGAAVLLLMGAQVLWATRGPVAAAAAVVSAIDPTAAAAATGWTVRRTVLGALVVTWLNPVALLDSALLFGGLVAATRAQDLPVLLAGMCAASALWTGGLLLVLRVVRARLAERARRWLERTAGAVVVLVGLRLAAQAAGVV